MSSFLWLAIRPARHAASPPIRWPGTVRFAILTYVVALLGLTMVAPTELRAQAIPPPAVVLTNKDHVDLLQQGVYLSINDVSIGNGALSLSHNIIPGTRGFFGISALNGIQTVLQSYSGSLTETYNWAGTPDLTITWSGKSSSFNAPTGTPVGQSIPIAAPSVIFATTNFSPATAGEQLINNGNYTFTYIQADGTQYLVDCTGSANSTSIVYGNITKVSYPDGRTLNIYYNSNNQPQSVVSNYGLQILFTYSSSNTYQNEASKVTAFNSAIDYCGSTASSCSFSQSWPTATLSWPSNQNFSILCSPTAGSATFSFTDMAGRVTTIVTDTRGLPLSLTEAGSSTPNVTYAYGQHCVPGKGLPSTIQHVWVNSSINKGAQSTYFYSPYNGIYQTPSISSAYKETDPLGGVTNAVSNGVDIGTVTMPDGAVYNYDGTDANQILSIVKPEGGTLSYTYDGRNNITQVTEAPKTGSSLASRTMTAGYDSTCTYIAKCNKPNWVKDYNGNETDFTYNTSTGQVLTVTGPAASSGVRPQTRYSYVQLYAWVKNSAGGYSQASSPISLLYQTSTCKTGAAAASGVGCAAGSSDEIITTYEYGPNSGPNNLWLRGMVVDSAGLALRTCYAYDIYGDKISETSPRANLSVCP